MPPGVLLICGYARRKPVGSADPLEPGWDLALIQAGLVTAVAADELKRVGVAAFGPALNDARRPAPQHQRPAMPWLVTARHACPYATASLPRQARSQVRGSTTAAGVSSSWRPVIVSGHSSVTCVVDSAKDSSPTRSVFSDRLLAVRSEYLPAVPSAGRTGQSARTAGVMLTWQIAARNRRYMGDRRSPSPSGHITLDIRVIIAHSFDSICGEDHPYITR
jgi:hypothetical protein